MGPLLEQTGPSFWRVFPCWCNRWHWLLCVCPVTLQLECTETSGPWAVGRPGLSLVPAQGSGHGRAAAGMFRSGDRSLTQAGLGATSSGSSLARLLTAGNFRERLCYVLSPDGDKCCN